VNGYETALEIRKTRYPMQPNMTLLNKYFLLLGGFCIWLQHRAIGPLPHGRGSSREPIAIKNKIALLTLAGLWCMGLGLGLGYSTGTAWALDNPSESPSLLVQARSRAIKQVLTSSRSDSAFLRANAIEASEHLPRRIVPLIQLGLNDPHPAVRFTALAMIGRLHLQELAPSAEPLLKDPSTSVRAAALVALYQCGRPVDISPLAEMFMSTDPTTRGNVTLLLGEMGSPDASAMLKDLAATPMPRAGAAQEALVRIQIAEAIVKLGDDSALNAIRASAYSQFDEVRVLAVSILGDIADHRMERAFTKMLLEPPIELQLAAATTLAKLGQHDGLPLVLGMCRSKIVTVRTQAAMSLAHFPGEATAKTLLSLLDDPQEQVRLSAAAAILRHISGL